MNCCKSVSTWQQLVFVTPGSTSSDHSYCMWLTFKLTNTFQTCVINHLINSYNSPPLGSVVACLLIDLIVHCLLFYNLITFIKRWWNHTYIDQNITGTWPTKGQETDKERGVGLDHAGIKNEAIGVGIHWPFRLAWFFQ